jgi:hypothetical protein
MNACLWKRVNATLFWSGVNGINREWTLKKLDREVGGIKYKINNHSFKDLSIHDLRGEWASIDYRIIEFPN